MRRFSPFPATCLFLALFSPHAAAQKKLDLQELLARHAAYLKRTDTPAMKSRAIEGSVAMTIVVGGSGTLAGTARLNSDEKKRYLEMKFGHSSYDHEWIVSDGEKIWVDLVNSNRRSDLGQFLLAQDQVFKEGLFGGALSASWPLAGGKEGAATMKYEGLKKISGKELHQVRYYTGQKGSDLEIYLYFDPQTYCHVRTTYLLSVRAGIASTPGATETLASPPFGAPRTEVGETITARQQTSRVRLEEEFDDFRNSEGYVIPAKWRIRLTTESQQSRIWEWIVIVTAVRNNKTTDPKEFEVK